MIESKLGYNLTYESNQEVNRLIPNTNSVNHVRSKWASVLSQIHIYCSRCNSIQLKGIKLPEFRPTSIKKSVEAVLNNLKKCDSWRITIKSFFAVKVTVGSEIKNHLLDQQCWFLLTNKSWTVQNGKYNRLNHASQYSTGKRINNFSFSVRGLIKLTWWNKIWKSKSNAV